MSVIKLNTNLFVTDNFKLLLQMGDNYAIS